MRRFLFASLLLAFWLGGCRSFRPGPALGKETVIVFEGVRSLGEEELLTAIRNDRYEDSRTRATKVTVDDAAYAVEDYYRRLGYPEALVEYEYEQGTESSTARIRVSEGTKVLLGEVRFEGNTEIDEEILGLFFNPTPKEERPFVRSQLKRASSGIEEYYYQRGWLRVRVEEVEVALAEGADRADLVCRIKEGPRFLLRSASLGLDPEVAAQEVEPAAKKSFEAEVRRAMDRAFVPPVSYGLRAALLEAYGMLGYPDAEVSFETELDESSGDVSLSFVVRPGEIVHIGDVSIIGREDAKRSLLRDRLALSEGDRFDSSEVRESFANLYRSGLFRSVQIELSDGPGEVRDLIVKVEELPSLELYAEPGYGSYEGLRFSFGADERNLFSTGTGLSFKATAGALAQGASLAWTDSWIDGGRFETRIGVSGNHREEPSFTQTETGTEWSLARVWNETHRTTLSYGFRRNELDDIDLDANDPLLEDALDDVNVASLSLSTTWDDRDGLFTPRSGGRKRVSFEWAAEGLGGEIDFLGANVEASHFFELSSEAVLAVRARSGVKAPIGGTESLPVQERYFNGGENTVRAFGEDELGPLDSGDEPLGGETFSIFSVELRQELFGKLEGGLFYDIGNVTSSIDDYPDFADLRGGPGIGLRYMLPIGPIRLDLAWNPSPRSDEDDLVLHLAVGMAF